MNERCHSTYCRGYTTWLCLQTRNSSKTKIDAAVKEKIVRGAENTVVAFVVTVFM